MATAAGPLFKRIPRDAGDRDLASYRAARKAWAADVLENEVRDEDWTEFKAQVRALGRTLDAAGFLTWLGASWLPAAHPDVRAIALREIAHRADAIRVEKGHAPLCDPLPGETPSLFIRARELLGVR